MGRYFEHDMEIRNGEYPKIHDKLKNAIDVADIDGKFVLDAGGCSGSFGLWCLRKGARQVVVNDLRSDYLALCKEYDEIHRAKYGYTGRLIVDNQKIGAGSDFTYKVDTLIARRIIYEIDDEVALGRFIEQLMSNGLKHVYLQGLVRVPNHKRKMWNVELEAQKFIEKGFKIRSYNGNDIMVLDKEN